jgi:hypothetical protein
LRNAEAEVAALTVKVQDASPAETPAWQGRLDVAIRHLDLLKKGELSRK